MRRFWTLLMLLLFVSLPLTFAGCSSQLSQDAADEFEEVHEGDDDEAGDTEEEQEEE